MKIPSARRLGARVAPLFACALFLASSGRASAQSLADRETARSLMDDGDKKRDAGDLKGALKNYQAADAIMKVPTTGLEVARAQIALGMLLEARETLGAVVRSPAKPGEPPPFVAARKAAEAMNGELAARIPSIQVVVTNAEPNRAPAITVDGEMIPEAAASAPRKVNPGAHVVVVKAGAAEKREEVSVVEGEAKTVTVDLAVTPAATPPAPTPTPSRGGSAAPKVMMFGGFGLAVVGLGVGAVTGLMSLSKTSDLKDACPNDRCPADKQAELDSTKSLGNISTIAFIAGGVGAGVGVVGLLMSGGGKDEAPASAARARRAPASAFAPENVRAVLGPSYVGVAGAF
ncbi:MAG: hypothetical protein KF795_25625 [Labilithrix sp.]|nr:hypothetical protein [Labilithrix sp.]